VHCCLKHKHTTYGHHIYWFSLHLVFVFLLCCRYENKISTEELEKKKQDVDASAGELKRQLKETVDARERKGKAIKECTK